MDFKNHSLSGINERFSRALQKKAKTQNSGKNPIAVYPEQNKNENFQFPTPKKDFSSISGSSSGFSSDNFDFKSLIKNEKGIIDDVFVKEINVFLPSYLRKQKFKLLYCTRQHGINLKTYH